MNFLRAKHRLQFFGWLATVLLLLVASRSPADAEGAFDGAGPIVVPAAAFNLDGFPGTDYFFSFGSASIYQSGALLSCFMAPLYMPTETVVTSVGLSAWDSSVSSNMTLFMRRTNFLTGGASQTMASVSTSGSSGFQTPGTRSISFPTIDNTTYKYSIETCLAENTSSSLRITAVTIGAAIFLDGFESGNTSAWTNTVP